MAKKDDKMNKRSKSNPAQQSKNTANAQNCGNTTASAMEGCKSDVTMPSPTTGKNCGK